MFENGDVENGESKGKVKGLVLLEGLGMGMDELVEKCCESLKNYVGPPNGPLLSPSSVQ